MTKDLIVTTDKKGNVYFRGFYGQYEVKITIPDGSIHIVKIHLDEKIENE